MTVTKILEQTLSAGSTSVSFTDADIPNSLIRVYSSNSDLIPVSRTLSGNTLTVTYEAQLSAIDVAVEIVKAGLDIVDNLTSTDADKALSAKQGKALKDDLDALSGNLDTLSDDLDTLTGRVDNLDIPDNITDLDDVTVTNIQSGQVLAWDGTKFVNVNQSGGSGVNYSTEEQVIGTWIDGTTLYRKVYNLSTPLQCTTNVWAYIQNSSLETGVIPFITNAICVDPNGTCFSFIGCNYSNSNFGILNIRNSNINVKCLIVEYTKTV